MSRTSNPQWRRLRLAHLSQHPWCAYCADLGHTMVATEVDHIVPVRQAPELQFEPSNLRSLCASCHNKVKQKEERTGVRIGTHVTGLPVDPGHHWNK